MYIYIYMYIYVYIHTYTYIHMHTHMYISLYIYIYIHTHTHTYISLSLSMYMYIYIYIYTHITRRSPPGPCGRRCHPNPGCASEHRRSGRWPGSGLSVLPHFAPMRTVVDLAQSRLCLTGVLPLVVVGLAQSRFCVHHFTMCYRCCVLLLIGRGRVCVYRCTVVVDDVASAAVGTVQSPMSLILCFCTLP